MGFLDRTVAGELVSKIKSLVTSELDKKKQEDAFAKIEELTGVPLDEKQQKAMLKAGIKPDQMVLGYKIKSMQEAAKAPQASNVINQAQQPGGLESLQQQFPMGAKASQGGLSVEIPSAMEQKIKSSQEKQKQAAAAEQTAKGTYRFLQQFERSYQELKAFDPEVDAVGVGGYLTRKTAKLAENLDALPETKALKIQIPALANGMAREIEGGKVTDQDRKVYADTFASAVNFPTKTNIRLMANNIIGLLDKGGDENGAISNQLKQLAGTKSDIFNSVLQQVITEYPELTKKIFGEDYEVKQ